MHALNEALKDPVVKFLFVIVGAFIVRAIWAIVEDYFF